MAQNERADPEPGLGPSQGSKKADAFLQSGGDEGVGDVLAQFWKEGVVGFGPAVHRAAADGFDPGDV